MLTVNWMHIERRFHADVNQQQEFWEHTNITSTSSANSDLLNTMSVSNVSTNQSLFHVTVWSSLPQTLTPTLPNLLLSPCTATEYQFNAVLCMAWKNAYKPPQDIGEGLVTWILSTQSFCLFAQTQLNILFIIRRSNLDSQFIVLYLWKLYVGSILFFIVHYCIRVNYQSM